MHAWLFGGGFDHLATDRFIELVEQQAWKAPSDVQLFVKTEGKDSFCIVDLKLASSSS